VGRAVAREVGCGITARLQTTDAAQTSGKPTTHLASNATREGLTTHKILSPMTPEFQAPIHEPLGNGIGVEVRGLSFVICSSTTAA
jgi:hypothetical protein